jgi:anti-sigma-K factor RskA
MIDDALHTQAALYALDALPPDEAAAFRSQLAEVPGLAEIVAEYQAAAAGIAEAAPAAEPPAALRGRILAAISEKPAATESRHTSWLPWALAAGFAFAAGALWVQNGHLRIENRGQLADWTKLNVELQSAKTDVASKDQSLASLQKELAVSRELDNVKTRQIEGLQQTIVVLEKRNALAETQVATLTSKLDGSYLASIAWDKSTQEGILHVRRLPAAGSGKDYQLWVIDPKYAAPVSAGIFTVQADGSATIRFAPTQKISDATTFAVSVEKTGGSASPEGPIVLSN